MTDPELRRPRRPRARGARALVPIAIAAVLTGARPVVEACAPMFERAVFTFVRHPDFPLAAYARGTLGIVEPNWARSYLVVAWRHLMGAPLTGAAADAADALWQERLRLRWDDELERARDAWVARRNRVTGVARPPEIGFFRDVPGETFSMYLNCPAGAFRRAAETHAAVATAWGASSGAALDWVRAQDAVFANCGGGPIRLPAPAPDGAPPALAAHRAYQIAAAGFYAGRFDEAERAFRAIADDPASPWRSWGPYLVARTLVRRATLAPGDRPADRGGLAAAQAVLRALLDDPTRREAHEAARGMDAYITFRLDPERRFRETAAALASRDADVRFRTSLDDYTRLLDRFLGDGPSESLARAPAAVRADPLGDWIATFQATDAASLDHAVRRWEATRAAPWLVAALAKLAPNDPRSAPLAAAAAGLPDASPAYATVAFHRARLAVGAGRTAEGAAMLDALLAARGGLLPASARNRFLGLRMAVAAGFDEFLRFAPRTPSATTWDDGESERPVPPAESRLAGTPGLVAFDRDATAVLNDHLPLERLAAAATHGALPPNLRHQIALAAWTRAVLLGEPGPARALAPVLGALAPEMRAGLVEYAGLADADERALAGLVLVLRFPGSRPWVDTGLGRETAPGRIDNYRDNWWCAAGPPAAPAPGFLSPDERTAAAAERARLGALPAAPNHLAAEAVRLAARRPADPRAPEALHLAVRATRYGCTDAGTGAASRRAFQLLHAKYPGTEWARRTPYWFSG